MFDYLTVLNSTYTGMTLRVKVEAINIIGNALSPALQFVLANIPGQPYPAPAIDITNTTTSQIKVTFANQNTDNGGSPVINLELQMDDGNEGDFTTIFTTQQ